MFLVRADGSGEPQRLTTSKNRQNPIAWHPGGKYLLFSEDSHATGGDLMLLPIDVAASGAVTAGSPQPFLTTSANEAAGQFSPDGKRIAYTSDESGRNEVYVRPFPSGAGRWQVSTEGAEWIEWRRNGQLFYGISDDVVMRVPYRIGGATFIRGEASGLAAHPARDHLGGSVCRWQPRHRDSIGDARTESVVLMVNFFEHLRRKLQGGR